LTSLVLEQNVMMPSFLGRVGLGMTACVSGLVHTVLPTL